MHSGLPDGDADAKGMGSRFVSSAGSRAWTLLACAVLLLLSGFHLLVVERLERPGADTSAYIQLAENLCRHGKYEFNFAPHVKYPPGFPLLLAAWMSISGQFRYEELLRLLPVFGAAALLVWFSALRSAFGPVSAAIVVLLTGVSLPYFDLATRLLMADIPFFFFSGLCFLLHSWLGTARRLPVWMQWLGIASLVLGSAYAVIVRNAGVAIAVAFLSWAAWPPVRKQVQWRKARNLAIAAGMSCLLGLLAWVGWSRSQGNSLQTGGHMSSYVSEFRYKSPQEPDLGLASPADYVARAARNTVVRSAQLASVAIPYRWVSPTWYSPVVFFTPFLLIGGIWSCRHNAWKVLFGLYLLAYLAVYALWPYDEDARFVVPVAPVAFLFFLEGARAAWRAFLSHSKSAAALVIAAAILALATALRRPPSGKQELLSLLFWAVAALASVVFLLWPRALACVERLDALRARRVRPAAAILATVLIAWGLAGQLSAAAENLHPDPSRFYDESARQAALWLRQAPPGNVMAGHFMVIHRLTGRLVASFPPTANAEAILDAMRRYQVRFLVVGRSRPGRTPYFRPGEEERLRRIQEAAPSLLRLVKESPDYFVFETDASFWRPQAHEAQP